MPLVRAKPVRAVSRPMVAFPGLVGEVSGNGATRPLPNAQYDFLDILHPIYKANRERWARNEARLAGGDNVLDELIPFDWEVSRDPTSAYRRRQQQAIYLNFPEIFTTAITGQMLRFSPKPGQNLSFGSLGEVRLDPDFRKPSRAEQLYYSVDKPSGQGQAWTPWWMEQEKLAMGTGHRWLFCETPPSGALNRQDEIDGLRPFLLSFSPLAVTNWYLDQFDELDFAIIRYNDYRAQFLGNAVAISGIYSWYFLLVRAGVTTFGPQFQEGGWWKFRPDKSFDSHEVWGPDTGGKVPMWPLFYERSEGTRDIPAMSRSGITELGQAAIAFMNVASSANFQAWDGGKGIEWLAGVDEDGMDLATQALKRGDRYIPLQPNQDTDATPQVFHSAAGQSASTAFTEREKAISFVATQLGIGEMMGATAKTTGANTSAQFTATQVPRLVKAAANLENAQRIGLYWLAKRFGVQPDGNAQWPTKFDLVELMDTIQEFFTVERLSGIRSKTIDAKAMTQYAVEQRIITTDAEKATALEEYTTSAKQQDQIAANQAAGLPAVNTDNLGQPGSIGGKMKTGRSAAKDKARAAGKNADRTTTKRQRTATGTNKQGQ